MSDQSLRSWLKVAEVEYRVRLGVTSAESQQMQEAKKRIRVLEQDVEILRRAAAYFAREVSSI